MGGSSAPPPPLWGGGKISKILFSSYFDEIRNLRVFEGPEHESEANFSVRPTPPSHSAVGGRGEEISKFLFSSYFDETWN